MTIEEQIHYVTGLPNSGAKFFLLKTLKMVQERYKANANNVIQSMSHETYAKFCKFLEFEEFIKSQKH